MHKIKTIIKKTKSEKDYDIYRLHCDAYSPSGHNI